MAHRNDPHRNDVKRIERCRQEAGACAAAALRTSIVDIRPAYPELEQGWLCLAPKPKESSDDSSRFELETASGRKARHALNEAAPSNAKWQSSHRGVGDTQV